MFVEASLEPIIPATADRLRHRQERGEMREGDARIAALQLVAPLLLADLHQQQLGSAAGHPLAMDALIDPIAKGEVRAYGVQVD